MDGNDRSSAWNYLLNSASARWFCAEEIFIALFADPASIGSNISEGFGFTSQFQIPQNGSLYIFTDRNALKADNVSYGMKKGKDRAQETYQKLKLNNVEQIRGVYSRADDRIVEVGFDKDSAKPVLKRRVYKLLKSVHKTERFLVHYRVCPEDERPEKHTLTPMMLELYHSLYSAYIKQQQVSNHQIQQQYASFGSFQSEMNNSMSEMSYPPQAPPQHQYQQQHHQQHHHQNSIYQHAQVPPGSFSNTSQTTAAAGSLDDFDNFDTDMMDDLIDFLDQGNPPSTTTSYSSTSSGYPAQLQATPPSFGAPQRRMTGENMPLPQESPQMQMQTDSSPMYMYQNQSLFSGRELMTQFPLSHQSPSPAVSLPTSLAPSPHLLHTKNLASHRQSPALQPTQQLAISDFSPSQDHQASGGTKVLICLASEIAEPFRHNVINIHFGDFRTKFSVKVRAELANNSTLRCKTPPNAPSGNCQIWIEDEQNALKSDPAEQPFEFLAPVSIGSAAVVSKLGKRSSFRDSAMRVDTAGRGSEAGPISPYGYRLPAHFANSILRRSSPLRGDSISNSDFDKEHKIRIVEKLGTMKHALTHDEPQLAGISTSSHSQDAGTATGGFTGRLTPRAQNAHSFTESGDVKWLDDQELSEMSTEELEVLMDRYIMEVVKQLVQLAVMDDDLKAEIDSLDSSGFSLLHYCCLYSLNSLIPVLLARGADVNRRNSTGSTALHLAAASGHLAVVQVLVESGAVVDSCDANNVLPSDAAYEAGYMDIYNLLLMLENREMDTSRTSLPAAEVTTEMHDANAQMLYGSSPVSSHNIAFLPTAPLPGPLGPLTFSPVATTKTRTEVPSLKFDSPPPSFPGEIFDPASVSLDGSNALSNKLLQEAFASLSLTDKCALSLSMGQLNPDGTKKTPASNSGVPSATSTPRTHSKASINSPLDGPPISLTTSALTAAAINDEMSEMQSVLSETDQESLQKAMSMMRHSELEQVEAEVRTIQNNVRAWILRKNYTNLREAARVLQGAWREKKRNALSHSDMLSTPSSRGTDSPSALTLGGASSAGHSAKLSSNSGSPSHAAASLASPNGSFGLVGPNRAQLQAAATLQAATRGMLARRSFSSVRKQTMASLVIQKSLVKWWEHNKVGGNAPAAKSSTN